MFTSLSNSLIRISSFVIFFLLWILASSSIDSSLLPGPIEVFRKIQSEYNNSELIRHTFVTLRRVFISFFIAMIIGTIVGIILGRKKYLNEFFDYWLLLGLNVPALVIIILCYVWFGLNESAAILAVSLNKIPMVAVIMREGARSFERDYLDVAKFYDVKGKKLLIKVIFPQLYPYLMSSARSGLSLIWKIVLVVELLGRSEGVGFKLFGFFQFFDITGILAYTFFFVAIILLIEFLFVRPVENRLTEWR